MLRMHKPFQLVLFPLAKALKRPFMPSIAPGMDRSRVGRTGEREIPVGDVALDKTLYASRARAQH